MNYLNVLLARFNKLRTRERLLAIAAVAVILYFIVDVALLTGQKEKIKALRQQDEANKLELASVNKTAVEAEKKAVLVSEQLSRDRAVLIEFKKQIADADALLDQADATSFQVGALMKELLDTSHGMTLVSLKTLPTTIFYTPEIQTNASGKTDAIQPSEAHKAIYRHGVEVSVKSNYMVLLPYMEKLQKYPKRLFWSSAQLDVSAYPDAVLKLVVYSLSDQPSSSLR